MTQDKMNIFEGAKFPDRFVTRDGHVVVFVRETSSRIEFVYQPEGCIYSDMAVNKDGKYWEGQIHDLDIVGKYHEPVDEQKLDRLVNEAVMYNDIPIPWDDCTEECKECFKIGYRKAKEE